MQEYKLPTDMRERGDYRVFPLDLEENPQVLFHATPLKNMQALIDTGFKRGIDVGGTLPSVSWAKSSMVSLDHWISHRQEAEDGVIIATRFETLDGMVEKIDTVYDYRPEPAQPKMIGYCVVPASYEHL